MLEQIYQFKKNNTDKKCMICLNTDNKLQVDHIKYFDELALDFINCMQIENKIIPIIFGEINDNTHRRCFLEIDNVFKNEWIDYHYKHASLRMLCQMCNLTRTKKHNKVVSFKY